jgi:hypothetical protein
MPIIIPASTKTKKRKIITQKQNTKKRKNSIKSTGQGSNPGKKISNLI